jgi:uncharacterized protein
MPNRLAQETSPYLLQHAHNPVDWYPWSEEALQKAVEEDKPILVSIGYSACHWCHVMERESFEDEATAAIMNQHFVCIKIDREERPDIDAIYMDAVQAMTGSGGWPLNVFLTPGKAPFYGGTYFPPVRAYNRSSWREVLHGIAQAYRERKEEVEEQAKQLMQHLQNSNAFGLPAGANTNISKEQLKEATENLLKQADTEHGGFGAAPKFPQTFSIRFLLRQYHFHQDEAALQQALLSLDKMIAGGIYDHLGGGFARYSVDAFWLAPHFEKMLYDNALLVIALSEAYQITQKPKYKQVIEATLAFVQSELMEEQSFGFYSALDADSEGEEGKYYVWAKEEIDALLGANSVFFNFYYGVEEQGNWEGTNILHEQMTIEQLAEQQGLLMQDAMKLLAKAQERLLAERQKRIRPGLDDKQLLGWNAMMNLAFTKAYAAIGNDDWLAIASKNMQFLLHSFQDPHSTFLLHTHKKGQAKYPAFLDDYAYLIEALIHLQEVTGNLGYLEKAKLLMQLVVEHFSDEQSQFFYYTPVEQRDVIVRKKEVYDGATPSGNSVINHCLHYLGIIFDRPDWVARAIANAGLMAQAVVRYPVSFGVWGMQMQNMVAGMQELAIVGPLANHLLAELLPHFLPNKVLQTATSSNSTFPLLQGKQGETTYLYWCEQYACSTPQTSVQDLLNLIKTKKRL